jgi:ABC-type transport system substrate-binding protein/ABC-type dipeptide/oligopeptide/nickel transport system permease component
MTGTGMLRRALRAAVIATAWCISGATPTAAAAPAPAAAEAPAAAAPQPAPQLAPPAVIGMQLEPPVLDPTVNPAAAIAEALDGNLYEGLVKFAPDGSVLPALAQSWEISGDGLTYVFHLRAGVRFHDGVAFDAAAAQFSLERALAADSSNPQRTRIGAIGSVRAIDDHTLVLSLSRRSGGLLQSLAWAAFVMVEPKSAATNSTRPIGTGPFRFRSWSRGDSLTLERNPDYWGGPATIAGVTFRFISDPTAAYAALMAGDVDAFSNYPAPESFPQFAADRRFKVFVGSTESETVLAMNNRHAPLDDLRVRRAIAHAIDREAVIDGAMFGFGTPIGSHFPPHSPDYVDLTGLYPHDVAEARALLAQAGYPHGFSVTLKLPPPSYARRSGEIVAAQLAAVGITARIENLEWAQWLDQVFTRHDYDLSIVAHAEPMDYDIYARDDYYFGYSNPEFKRLMAALDDSIDSGRRRTILQSIQRKIAEDSVNGFLFQYPRLAVWSTQLQGVDFDDLLGAVELKDAHFEGAGRGAARRLGSGAHPAARILGGVALAVAASFLVFAWRRFGAFYLAGRLAVLIATLAAATAAVFVIVQIVPGDPVRYMMGLQADANTVMLARHQLGLDAPALERYLHWIAGLVRGDFGISYTYRVPVAPLIAERLQVSLPLALYALSLACALAFPVGFASAARRGRASGAALSMLTQIGLAVPNFWLGMLLVMVFAIGLHLTSAGGFPGWSAGLWPVLRALTLPALALALPQAAILARVLRGALIDILREDFVRTARAKGASEARILWKHALPNALIPVLTILGMQFSFLLAGAVIIENVFFLPGLGRLVFQAIEQRDLIVVQSVVMVLVFAVVCVTFLVDLSYRIVNPRLGGELR